MSRHWYNLATLADNEIGRVALLDRTDLETVVRYKKVFFPRSTTNYDACLEGRFRIVPDTDGLAALANDYREMIDSGIFLGEPPTCEAVAVRLRELEDEINS